MNVHYTVMNLTNSITQEFISILGKQYVLTQESDIISYSRSTLSHGTIPSAILEPSSKEEIIKIITIASNNNLKIYPISTGKNWGYSDACAPQNDNVVLNLRRMNRILEINTELGYVTLEPGVTQGQLYEFLENNSIPLWMDATGAGADTSIIGNVLERGFGHSPYGDRYANSCGYEIILPTGEVISTGFGNFTSSKVTETYKWGVGPLIDGLFTQSNLGIVTKITLWLLPKPETFKTLLFILKNEKDIEEFIERMRPLRMNQTIRSVMHINNDMRTLSLFQRFPFETADSTKKLSSKERKALQAKFNLGFWTGTAGLYGSKQQVQADYNAIKNGLEGFKGLKLMLALNTKHLSLFKKLLPLITHLFPHKYFQDYFHKLIISHNLLQGKSPSRSVAGSLWKVNPKNNKTSHISSNPLDNNSGFYWISPVLPMKGSEIAELNMLIEPLFTEHGFDLLQTISLVNERTLCAVTTISFDKTNNDEVKRAEICHDEVTATLINNGYILYRAGNHAMKFLYTQNSPYTSFLKKIKKVIDPNNILSPGKYIPD